MRNGVDLGPMARHIAFQIHLTWRAMRKRFLADAKQGDDRVTRGSYSVPILIGLNPGISPQQLASSLYLDASKVTVLLRDMERAGHVARRQSPSDGRSVELHLTEAGELFMRHALDAGKRMEKRWRELLTEEEAAELIRLLGKIRGGPPADAA